MQQIGVAQGKKQNGEQERRGRGWSSLAKPSCDGHVAGSQRGGSGGLCKDYEGGYQHTGCGTRYTVHGTRFTTEVLSASVSRGPGLGKTALVR
jgi:hypothetical protein